MIRFILTFWRLIRGADLDNGCRHAWNEDALGHRHCPKCQERQMLYENRYPEPGEPKYEWH